MLAIASANPSETCYQHIIDGIEKAVNSEAPSFHCDLFLPNCFITKYDKNDFWFGMAHIMTEGCVQDWHTLEFGPPLNSADKREKYVYSWTSKSGDLFRFYTKILNDGYNPELIWYIGKYNDCDKGLNTNEIDNDTEDDEIILHT